MTKTQNAGELLASVHGYLGHIVLNRPEALNALSQAMIHGLTAILTDWVHDPAIHAVLITGAGDRAFCAGGDIRAVWQARQDIGDDAAFSRAMAGYFGAEYRMNRLLFHYPKPLIAVMDGITMGGGFGVAGPCRFRIATERTKFAMPEVGIGFFPDVGSTYFLNRCPGRMGDFLAVTGTTIGAGDVMYGGLATHYIPSSAVAPLTDVLAAADLSSPSHLAGILQGFWGDAGDGDLVFPHAATIDRVFSGGTVEEILVGLNQLPDAFATSLVALIGGRSPLSLKIALEHLRRARGLDFDAVTAMDFTLSQHFMAGHDFFEGVRAAIIDKDKTPRWRPAVLAETPDSLVECYFKSTGLNLENTDFKA